MTTPADHPTPAATTPAVPDQTPLPVTTVPPVAAPAAWPVAQMLSPLSAFEPDRVDLCTRVQMALVDDTPSASHLEAATHHLRSAADRLDREDRPRIALGLLAAQRELHRIADALGLHRTGS